MRQADSLSRRSGSLGDDGDDLLIFSGESRVRLSHIPISSREWSMSLRGDEKEAQRTIQSTASRDRSSAERVRRY